MATPYFVIRPERVASTMDVAREHLEDLPVLVMTGSQTEGRGRSGREWIQADRALAVSLAMRLAEDDHRPFSLMAGVAMTRTWPDATLKWPNDVIYKGGKAGGILVERSGGVVVVGMGVNLWWATWPEGMTCLYEKDPGPERYAEIGGLWGAELMRQIDGEGWPRQEYLSQCSTLGAAITWEPDGSGTAIDIADDGGLVVDTPTGRLTLHFGEVHHVR